jgi:catalase
MLQVQAEVQTAPRTKKHSLKAFTAGTAPVLTTNQGLQLPDNHNSLKAGARGPTLLEDFILREKITHFGHERIPERAVNARGSGAHGYFKPYKSMVQYTSAAFLQDPDVETPVFVRFSTVAGSKGSADTVRDVRGFAVKFYTSEGNYDLVGNNIPVFFIQDAIKFPDLIHALKPEPHHEMPQAASAHDTFWDFASLMPETTHMLMWAMSDRAIPRSLRMMEGFGVHAFRFINARGDSSFVKFHWKPKLGVHGLVWDEAQKIAGKDADFHRRDLWEAIESGNFPEWELGVQIVDEGKEAELGFDILDPTKLIPEEQVPVQLIGKMVLNRNPDNFFAETEQVAFHPGHLVPGIDFSNDPLLQGRLFLIPTPSCRAWAVRISMRFPSTARSARCITSSATACTARPSPKDGLPTSRTHWQRVRSSGWTGARRAFSLTLKSLSRRKSGAAARLSTITFRRPRCSGTARLLSKKTTSWRRSALSFRRWKHPTCASASWTTWRMWI